MISVHFNGPTDGGRDRRDGQTQPGSRYEYVAASLALRLIPFDHVNYENWVY